jgi:serine/threonine protein kinase
MYLNEKKIIHRDLKPANIFISKSGNLKIGDLGLGREISETTDNCFTRVGTPLYMAPEIIKGEGYMYSCDVWSLGCVAYELVELTSPFRKIG